MSAYWLDLAREIRFSLGRFLSLLVITALGAASVVGIQASAIEMRTVADETYKAHRLYDLEVRSPVGLNETDLAAISEVPGVSEVMGTASYDLFVDVGDTTVAARAWALPDGINQITLQSGRLPANPEECVVEPALLSDLGQGIGYELPLTPGTGLGPSLINLDHCAVVGTVTSPLYITSQRGSTQLGNGTLGYFLYLHPEAFPDGLSTVAFVLMTESAEMDQLTDDYNVAARRWRTALRDEVPQAVDWIIDTRQDGLAFDGYFQDTLRLARLGYVFPLVFFAVAALVSLTTMSRMVEDQRTQIGILKALGYQPIAIIVKYALYAFLASILGAALGVVLGYQLFPRVITEAYGRMYEFPSVTPTIPWGISIIAASAAVGSVVLVTVLTGIRTMIGSPALLMRPRPPARGRRVLLERITPLWRRIGFFGKVTARNIFRYKRRFFMTLVGVAGCAALLVTAFGLRDSISAISSLQFEQVVKHDARAFLAAPISDELRDELGDDVLPVAEVAVTVSGPQDSLDANLMVPETYEELSSYVQLQDWRSGEPVTLDNNSVLLTDKLADEIGVTVGDQVEIARGEEDSVELPVAGILENYVGHNVYLSAEHYRDLFDETPAFTSLLIRTDDAVGLSEELLARDDVLAVVNIADHQAQLAESTDALGVVTVVLVVLACALALVVLFNLTNINILERTRELATLKVLGFSSGELAMYVYRENLLVIALGILLGLGGGVLLHAFVLSTIEIDLVRFPIIISPWSFLYAIVLSSAFALFVNLVMNRKLANIDMVESLKAVE